MGVLNRTTLWEVSTCLAVNEADSYTTTVFNLHPVVGSMVHKVQKEMRQR